MSTELSLENPTNELFNSKILAVNGRNIIVESNDLRTLNYASELLDTSFVQTDAQINFRIKVKKVSELEILHIAELIQQSCTSSYMDGFKIYIGEEGKYFISQFGYISFQPFSAEYIEVYSTIPLTSISCMIRKYLIDSYSSEQLDPQYFHGNAINDNKNERTLILASSGSRGRGSRKGKTTISLALAAARGLDYSFLANDDVIISPISQQLLSLPAEIAIRSGTVNYLADNGTALQVQPEHYMDKREKVNLATKRDLRNSGIRIADINYERLDWYDIDLNLENKYSTTELLDSEAILLLQKNIRKRRVTQTHTPLVVSEEIPIQILSEDNDLNSVLNSFEKIKRSGGKFYRLQGGYDQNQIHQLLEKTNG